MFEREAVEKAEEEQKINDFLGRELETYRSLKTQAGQQTIEYQQQLEALVARQNSDKNALENFVSTHTSLRETKLHREQELERHVVKDEKVGHVSQLQVIF